MPLYHFDIASNSRRQVVDLADDEAAWREARAFCRDMSRDIIDAFDIIPEWQLDVSEADGRHLCRFRLLADRSKT
jgi:hypothetical protein